MSPLASQRQRLSTSVRDGNSWSHGDLYESNDRNLTVGPGPNLGNRPNDGRGGVAGLRDPYDRPLHGQLEAAQSRLRQDKATKALYEIAARYRVMYGSHHVVRKGLRRSIADAYAAYVGQVVNLPEDTYGLALRALDRTFNTNGLPVGAVDQNLHTSPYSTSRLRRAQIFNTAHKIMRDLEGYVYDISYYCPGELDELREMRRPGISGDESYKSTQRLRPGEPPPGREAVPVAPRQLSVYPPGAGRSRAHPRVNDRPSNPTVNPVSGAFVNRGGERSITAGPVSPPGQQRSRPRPPRPQTAPPRPRIVNESVASGSGAGAAVADAAAVAAISRDVGAALVTAKEAEVAARRGGNGPEVLDPVEDRLRRNWRRQSSPGMFTKTPPHYRISKYYHHVSPSQEGLKRIRQRAVAAAQAALQAAAKEKEEIVNASPIADGREGRHSTSEAAGAVQGTTAIATGTVATSRSLQHSYTRPRSTPLHGSSMSPGRGEQGPRFAAVQSPPLSRSADGGYNSPQRQDSESHERNRIQWIVDSMYELGLAEALWLEGPQQYERSQRLWPHDHRRQFFNAVYSSPERYASYAPYTPISPTMIFNPHLAPSQHSGAYLSPAGGEGGMRGGGAGSGTATPHRQPQSRDGLTVDRLGAAAARRYVRQMMPESEAQMYPRSQRLSP